MKQPRSLTINDQYSAIKKMENFEYIIQLANLYIDLFVTSEANIFMVHYLLNFIKEQHLKHNHIRLNLIINSSRPNKDLSYLFHDKDRKYFG